MFQSIRRDVDPDDRELAEERRALHASLSKSPFVDRTEEQEEEERLQAHNVTASEQDRPWNDGFVVRVANDVPWIDLILEIAMTTALANLVENSTISRGVNVFGYFCFWALTWWVWASAVAFNVRFRQSDLVNRGAVTLQLAIFGSLSAYTTNFNITAGLLTGENKFDRVAQNIQSMLNVSTVDGLNTHEFANARIPVLDFRGISLTMALSRMILLIQYTIVFFYAVGSRPRSPRPLGFLRASPSLLAHIVSLILSTILFFVAFGVIGHHPTEDDNIAKIVLWYTALLIELAAHFVPPLFKLSGHVSYPPAGLYSRASVLFIVVLGQELDKITGTFRFMVGPVGFNGLSVALLICTGIILVGQFSLFFGSPSLKTRRMRGLLWFFGQFFYTLALIVLLSGVVDQLINFNLKQTQTDVFRALQDVVNLQEESFPRIVTVENISAPNIAAFNYSGVATSDVIGAVYFIFEANDTADVLSRTAQLELELIGILLQQFEVYPEPDDPLFWELELSFATSNPSYTNQTEVYSIISQFLRSNLDSSKWFPAAAGMSFFLLGVLRMLRDMPRDKWEWANALTLIVGGLIYLPLCIMDLDSWKQIEVTGTGNSAGLSAHFTSAIWQFAHSGWALPSFSILTLLVMATDSTCHYLARRSYIRLAATEGHKISNQESNKFHKQASSHTSSSNRTVNA